MGEVRTKPQKSQNVEEAKARVKSARDKARKGDYDGAITDAETAAGLDPSNKDAKPLAQRLRQEKEIMDRQLVKAGAFMADNRFTDAQREFTVAFNISSYYKPVQKFHEELKSLWSKYDQEVRKKIGEVRVLNEKKDFSAALAAAAAWRSATRLDPYAEKELKEQEDWARKWKDQKDKQLVMLKAGMEKTRAGDFTGAIKDFESGFANSGSIYNGREPEYKEAVPMQTRAAAALKRLRELSSQVQSLVEGKDHSPGTTERGLKNVKEALGLQPNNSDFIKWRKILQERLLTRETAPTRADQPSSTPQQAQKSSSNASGSSKKLKEAVPIDLNAKPTPVVSSGSFICKTWGGTRMDAFSVEGGTLTSASFSLSQGRVIYNLSGNSDVGETVSLYISGSQWDMAGYMAGLDSNRVLMSIEYHDEKGNPINTGKHYDSGSSKLPSLSGSLSGTIPANAAKVVLKGTFTCDWSTPYAKPTETVGVHVTFSVRKLSETKNAKTPMPTDQPAPPTAPVGTQLSNGQGSSSVTEGGGNDQADSQVGHLTGTWCQ